MTHERDDPMMWITGNFRRNLLDMHIDDWNDTFLSKINAKEYVDALEEAGFQSAMSRQSRIPAFVTTNPLLVACTRD